MEASELVVDRLGGCVRSRRHCLHALARLCRGQFVCRLGLDSEDHRLTKKDRIDRSARRRHGEAGETRRTERRCYLSSL